MKISVYFSVNSSFKLFLELEPQIRDIIFKFYESKYACCLKLLDEIKVGKYSYYNSFVLKLFKDFAKCDGTMGCITMDQIVSRFI